MKQIEIDVISFVHEETARLQKKHPAWDKFEIAAKVQDNLDFYLDNGRFPK